MNCELLVYFRLRAQQVFSHLHVNAPNFFSLHWLDKSRHHQRDDVVVAHRPALPWHFSSSSRLILLWQKCLINRFFQMSAISILSLLALLADVAVRCYCCCVANLSFYRQSILFYLKWLSICFLTLKRNAACWSIGRPFLMGWKKKPSFSSAIRIHLRRPRCPVPYASSHTLCTRVRVHCLLLLYRQLEIL